MKLSIVIVNYNVKFFLEQCLHSVEKAIKHIEAEVFVVDNNSVDGSCAMVSAKFPTITLIENKINTGFSKANNQAIRLANGEYVLLLNPDTLVEENTFTKVVDFMDNNSDAGGLGVKMIDGNGKFLPESKRALPTPMVSFYKIFGLSRLFPKSKTFGRYHLGHLDNDSIHKVDVLSGAFMLLRKKTLDEIGLLDEEYFMYGEDIDLSYRIQKGGYENYYYPETTIIHYKGESTKKGSINYVLVFYNAMIIFAKKHFSQKNAFVFSFLIKLAIYFRATLSIIKRFLKNIFLPVIDTFAIYAGYYIITPYWEKYLFGEGKNYPDTYLKFAVPAYILIWLGSVFFSGGYSKPVKIVRLLKGLAVGTLIILIVYALLNEGYRFSRVLILIGSLWAFASLSALRFVLHKLNLKDFRIDLNKKKKIIIVGNQAEILRTLSLLKQTSIKQDVVGVVYPEKKSEKKQNNEFNNKTKLNIIGNITQLKDIVKINKIDEIVFCAKDIPAKQIIKNMLQLSDVDVDYKIAPPESISIIGSNSINTAGELYIVNVNSISKKQNKRNKRLLDIVIAVIFMLFSPILVFVVKNKIAYLANSFNVLIGKKSWVGYMYIKDKQSIETSNNPNLPKIKDGILTPLDIYEKSKSKKQKNKAIKEVIDKINIIYAKDYKISTDLFIIIKGLRHLGRNN